MRIALFLVLLGTTAAFAQDNPKPAPGSAQSAKAGAPDSYGVKTFQLKYADPEELRRMFAGRSFVMDANRDLQVLTVHGSSAFLKEVEDAVKQFDVPPPPPSNIEITIYLLTVPAQAPSGKALPKELSAIGKEFAGSKLADSQMLRVREGLGGEAMGVEGTPTSARLARVRFQSASKSAGPKGAAISLNGLQVWLNMLSATTGDAGHSELNTAPDVSAAVDIEENQPAVVARVGVDKPVAVVVRAVIVD